LSSHAGLALLDDFAKQLGVTRVLDAEVHVKQRERGYRESEPLLSLSHNLIIGGSYLLVLELLRITLHASPSSRETSHSSFNLHHSPAPRTVRLTQIDRSSSNLH